MLRFGRLSLFLAVPLVFAACGDDRPGPDTGTPTDAAADTTPSDTGTSDTAVVMDSGSADTSTGMDSTISDATPDAVVDAAPDAGADAGPPMATNVYRFGAAENDIISDVAVASDGTVFASGSVRSGTITIGTFTLPSAGPGSNVVVFARATDGSIRWARRFPGTSLFDTGTRPSTALALAADGTLWLASTFSGDADFGDGVMRSASWRACYVLTLDPTTGDPTVESVLGGAQLCEPHDIGLRTGGGFVIGGMFNGPLDLGGGALVTGSMPGQFVAAFDGGGSHVWSRAFADATIGRTSFDDAGNVYVCGGARDTTDIGDGTHDVAGSYAPFVSSFDGSGTNRWATVFPASEGSCYSVSTSPAGRSALVLLPSGSSRRIVIGATTYGAGETVLLGITAAGADDWAQPLPRTPWAYGDRGPGETLLLTGFVEADEDFGGGTRMAIGGGFDAFSASYDLATGAHRWSDIFGSSGYEVTRASAPNGSGGAWIGGTVQGDATPFVSGDYGRRDLLLFEVVR